MARNLHVACLQTRPMPTFEAALDEVLPLAREAVEAGADVMFLPEYCGGLASDGTRFTPPAAPEGDHPFLLGIQEFVAEANIWTVIGSVAVQGVHGKTIIRGMTLCPMGQIDGRYDKLHLFDVELSPTLTYRESATVEPGMAATLVEAPIAKIGHTICYDLRFPHLYRDLAKAGAEILAVPAAFTKTTGRAHWHVLNRARAIENLAFVVSPCAVGDVPGGGESYGHSLIINPWGEVLADGGDQPGVVSAVIDLDEVVAARSKIPSLSHDRAYKLGDSSRSVA